MSVTIMAKVWPMELPTTEKIVLLALADAANDDGVCWPSVSGKRGSRLSLTSKTSLSERAVQGAIQRLVAAGHLERFENPGHGVRYLVSPRDFPLLDAVPPAPPAPPQQLRPRRRRTPAAAAPAQEMPPTPAADAGDPRSSCAQTINEPSRTINAAAAARGARAIVADDPPDDPAGDDGGDDLMALVADCCRRAGVPAVSPGQIAAAVEQLRDWLAIGCDPPMIRQVIAARRDRATEPVKSLRYFDAAMRQRLAQRDFGKVENGKRSDNPAAGGGAIGGMAAAVAAMRDRRLAGA